MILRKPLAFGAAVMVAYFVAILPVLVYRHFDFSVFIVASDQFVDAREVASPIVIRTNSTGYDGEFYYRMALAPFSLAQKVFGITFDAPAWRMQRIGYPLIAWGLSLGHAAWVPASLVFTNLIGLGVIAFFASRIALRLRLDAQAALLVVLWPGFIVTLMHDTTEIAAAAFLAAALDLYFAGRIFWFGFLGALATLTRETSILVLGGILVLEAMRFWRERFPRETAHRVLICGAALIPFLLWRQAQQWLWGESPAAVAAANLDWPFVGPLEALRDALTAARVSSKGRSWFISTSFDTIGILFLLMFTALVLWHAFACRRADSAGKALVFGWLPALALMMSVTGPWIEPTGYFRAFTECFIIGAFILYLKPDTKLPRGGVLVGTALLWIGAWGQNTARELFTALIP
jgi:hypothetical protein